MRVIIPNFEDKLKKVREFEHWLLFWGLGFAYLSLFPPSLFPPPPLDPPRLSPSKCVLLYCH